MDLIKSSGTARDEFNHLKENLVNQILLEFDSSSIAPEDFNQVLVDLIMEKFRELKISLSDEIRNPLFHQIIDEVLGFGILQPFLDDPNVTEILVNGHENIFIEKNNQIIQAEARFKNNAELVHFIHRNIKRLGFEINPNNPTLDVRLPDYSKLSIVLPPLAIEFPILSIQKFSPCKLSISDLLESGMLSDTIAAFIQSCVISRLNLIIIGLGQTGKTTLLNSIASFIPLSERIISVEEFPELNLPQKQLLHLESKLPRHEGDPSTTPSDLIHLGMPMHPKRIIIGEMKGSECLALLQAMNTGCSGSMATMHASSPADAISRMENMCFLSGINFPIRVIREQIASAVDVIFQVARLKDGSRRITTITEISGMESDNIILTDIFRFEQTGSNQNRILGSLKPTGIRPLFASRLEKNGYKMSPEIFGTNFSEFSHGEF
ncbi:MAG: CpaF family protein [Anaerolineaceae bacterium]